MGDTSSSLRSLNDDFAATTPSGDSVFAKPLGDKCVWKTPSGGCVAVSFMFDPKQKYARNHVFASVTQDCFGDFRDQLTRHLLDEKDIAPKTKTLQETLWETITSTISKETLAKHVFDKPEKLNEYLEIITKNVQTSFHEEKLMTEALQIREFSFSYQVGIDAYPQQIRGKKPPAGEKSGVLTLHIQGMPKDSEAAHTELNGLKTSTPDEKDDKRGSKDESSANSVLNKKRKLNEGEEDMSDKDKLLQDLGLAEEITKCVTKSEKEFPLTATLFFESVGRWFSATVSQLSTKMERARNRNPLYQ